MNSFHRPSRILTPLALACLLTAGTATAQSQTANPPQPRETGDKPRAADADKAGQGPSAQRNADKAPPRTDTRKPKRDRSTDGKDSGRELEEEEDI